jgi:transcriptional regulator with XRE-family HTH domain
VSIGKALAEARRHAGLTVAQVGRQTGMSEASITAIEGNDYSACGDSLTQSSIRSIARVVGADPEPLIHEYNTGQPWPQPATDNRADPATTTSTGKWLWRAWLAVVTVVVVWVSFVMFQSHAGLRHGVTAAPPAPAHPLAHSHSRHHKQAPTTPTTLPARMLTPVSATAYGSGGAGQGDNSDIAYLAIDAHPGTAWHTDWYATARFGNLYPGTGLLVDMGRTVTITAAQITLGRSHGARLQLRIGAAPVLADLPPVAHVANAGGVMRMRLTAPAHGRYVLIWFTRLPRDPAGNFQASVYSLRLEGRI